MAYAVVWLQDDGECVILCLAETKKAAERRLKRNTNDPEAKFDKFNYHANTNGEYFLEEHKLLKR